MELVSTLVIEEKVSEQKLLDFLTELKNKNEAVKLPLLAEAEEKIGE
jgi:hypothetical protein